MKDRGLKKRSSRRHWWLVAAVSWRAVAACGDGEEQSAGDLSLAGIDSLTPAPEVGGTGGAPIGGKPPESGAAGAGGDQNTGGAADDGGAVSPPGGAGAGGTDAGGQSAGSAGREETTGGVSPSGGAAGDGGSLVESPVTATGGRRPSTGGRPAVGGTASAGAGAGGEAGAEPGLGARSCVEICTTDADCTLDGVDFGMFCDGQTGICRPRAACSVSSDCLAEASGWLFDCSSDADCVPEEVCIEVSGAGKCALSAQTSCLFSPEVITRSRFAEPGPVDVCGDTSWICKEGWCSVPCEANDCSPLLDNGSLCNLETGLCECQADADCLGPGVSRCNLATGECECASDADCSEPGANLCVAGRCSCSDVSVCELPVLDGTTGSCQ